MWTFKSQEELTQKKFSQFSKTVDTAQNYIMKCVEKGDSTKTFFTKLQKQNPELYKDFTKKIMNVEDIKNGVPLPTPSQAADHVAVECMKSIGAIPH